MPLHNLRRSTRDLTQLSHVVLQRLGPLTHL